MEIKNRLCFRGDEIRYLTLTFCESTETLKAEWKFETLWRYLNQSDLIKQWLVDQRLIPLRFGREGESPGDQFIYRTYWMVEVNLSHPYFLHLSLEEQWLEIQRMKVAFHQLKLFSDIHFYLILERNVDDCLILSRMNQEDISMI